MRRWLTARPEHQHVHACRAAVHRLVPLLVEVMTASEGEVAQLDVGIQNGACLCIKGNSHAAESWHGGCIEPIHGTTCPAVSSFGQPSGQLHVAPAECAQNGPLPPLHDWTEEDAQSDEPALQALNRPRVQRRPGISS